MTLAPYGKNDCMATGADACYPSIRHPTGVCELNISSLVHTYEPGSNTRVYHRSRKAQDHSSIGEDVRASPRRAYRVAHGGGRRFPFMMAATVQSLSTTTPLNCSDGDQSCPRSSNCFQR